MKIHRTEPRADNRVTSYGAQYFRIADEEHRTSVILNLDGSVTVWDVQSANELSSSHIDVLLKESPDVVIIGTGTRQLFPDSSWMAAFPRRNVGLEVMDSSAACRTFNVLRSEERAVVAALMLIT
jgi:uncharacterized protein